MKLLPNDKEVLLVNEIALQIMTPEPHGIFKYYYTPSYLKNQVSLFFRNDVWHLFSDVSPTFNIFSSGIIKKYKTRHSITLWVEILLRTTSYLIYSITGFNMCFPFIYTTNVLWTCKRTEVWHIYLPPKLS